jgi:GT2 family glycosyltransferase
MIERIEIDVILVSYAQTDELKQITIDAITSLMESESSDLIKFNIIVVESEKSIAPYQYPKTITVYPDAPFGYHRYLNIGIEMTSSAFICVCNNDLLFHKNWATEILKPFYQFNDVYSASPACSIHHPKFGFKLNDGIKLGYRIRYEVAGWCIFFKRDVLRIIGQLDENYIFWCADNDYANALYCMKLNHILVTSSIVDHLESKTLKKQSQERELELTEGEMCYFKKKWDPRWGTGWKALD